MKFVKNLSKYFELNILFKIFFLLPLLVFINSSNSEERNTADFFDFLLHNNMQVVPSIYIRNTWSDNKSLQSSSIKSGWVTDISPGIRINNNSRTFRFNVDYSLHKIINKGDGAGDSLQNTLNSLLFVEAIENFIFFDASANVSQKTISAFGRQVVANGINDSNKTEVSSFGITPYVKGSFSDFLNYEGRYSLFSIRAKNLSSINSIQSLTSLKLSGDSTFNRLKWSINAVEQITSKSLNSDTHVDNIGLTLTYLLNNQLVFYATSGREVSNYTLSEEKSYSTNGGGGTWTPSAATKFSVDMNKHQLGNMHKLSFEHRTPRTSWSASDNKNISLSSGQTSGTSLGSNYYLLYNQFSLIEPDPIKRDKLVRDFMLANGISSDSVSLNGYLTSGTSVQRSQDISFALLGQRDTVTFSISKNTGKRIDTTFISTDDFYNSSEIRQNGFGVIYSHKITPDSVVSMQFSMQKVKADFESQNSLIRSINLNYSSKLALKTFVTMSFRHVIYSANISSYKENAIVGSLMVQF